MVGKININVCGFNLTYVYCRQGRNKEWKKRTVVLDQ